MREASVRIETQTGLDEILSAESTFAKSFKLSEKGTENSSGSDPSVEGSLSFVVDRFPGRFLIRSFAGRTQGSRNGL